MTPPTPARPRPLPPAVYWRRRLFVLGTVLALVLVVVNVVRGEPEPAPGVRASTAAADPAGAEEPEAPATGPSADPSGTTGRKGTGRKGKRGRATATDPSGSSGPPVALPTAPVLAEPEGECAIDDLSVTPTVKDAVAGDSATIVLVLRTLTTPACTWTVASDTLVVRISVGDDEVWASRHCPGQLPTRTVVVRQAVSSTYELTWNTRRSDVDCPELTEYAEPGDYRVSSAPFGGEAADLVFDLAPPSAPEPAPEKQPQKKEKRKPAGG